MSFIKTDASKRTIPRSPRKFTPEIEKEICEAVSCTTFGLETLCEQNPHWPTSRHILLRRHNDENFDRMYARAKELQVEANMNKLQNMIDEDHYQDINSNKKIDSAVFRAKIDAIKWISAKLVPRKYADVVVLATNNQVHEQAMLQKHEIDEKNKKDY